MIKNLALILLLFFGCFLTTVDAVEVKDLYLVKLPVAEQGKTALRKVSLEGFKEVLVRKSGSSAILQSEEVRRAYRKVTSYLQRFEYARQEDPEELSYIISLYFEPRLIDGLIQESKMPLWGSNRPLTIVWLAVEEGFERKIVVENSLDNSSFELLQANGLRRGLPIILPLMDLEDELVVSISDIWGRFPTAIETASERYAADVALYGRINQLGDLWVGKFSYLNQGNENAFDLESESKEALLGELMDRLADELCNKYCVVEEVGLKNELLVDVSDINNFQEFKQAEDYLSSLSSVSKVELVSIEKFNVLFKLTLLGQVDSTIEGIALSQKMIAIEAPTLANIETSPDGLLSDELINDQQTSNLDGKDLTGATEEASLNDEEALQQILGGEILPTDPNQMTQQPNELPPLEIQKLYYRWLG